jgi:tRNA (cytidine/uridine-2'-O-)-methyltransferase
MFEIVLVHPEIAPNTGNVIRLAANTGCRLHLVEPMGFVMSDRGLKRAGLDYHEHATVQRHPDWAACLNVLGDARRFAFTTRGSRRYSEIAFQPGDAFVFGAESCGLPDAVLAGFPPQCRLRLPMRPASRSLNLGNSVAAVVFEGWRQQGFAGGV